MPPSELAEADVLTARPFCRNASRLGDPKLTLRGPRPLDPYNAQQRQKCLPCPVIDGPTVAGSRHARSLPRRCNRISHFGTDRLNCFPVRGKASPAAAWSVADVGAYFLACRSWIFAVDTGWPVLTDALTGLWEPLVVDGLAELASWPASLAELPPRAAEAAEDCAAAWACVPGRV
jgi:hypothetical protein